MTLAIKRSDVAFADEISATRAATSTSSGIQRRFDFTSLTEALDYAATGRSGFNFYSDQLELTTALPYRDLREAAITLARQLIGAGVRRGDRVALVAETSPDFIIAFAACQYGGLLPVPMPLPSAFGGRDVYVSQIRHMAQAVDIAAAIAPGWVMPWLEEAASGLDLKVLGTAEQLAVLPEAAVDLAEAGPASISYLQFSSGSTRAPAGIAITHRALMANTAAIVGSSLAVRNGDRAVSWLPFYHDMGLVGFLLAPLVGQISADFMATRDFARRPLNWLRLMDANGGTISYSPSFGYELCAKRVASGQAPKLDLSSWRVAGIGGDMIRPEVLDQFSAAFASAGFRPTAFVPSYGLAEATLAVTFGRLDQGMRIDRVDSTQLEHHRRAVPANGDGARSRDFVVCGRVIPGHRVEIRDEEGAPLQDREVGRVFVQGSSLMTGYERRPEDTAEILTEDGWLDTGDLGYMIGDDLVVTGRSKEIIIINGRNLWPQDLEYTVEQVDGVRHGDAAAFSIEKADMGVEQVVVLVQCRTPDPDARKTLVQAVTARLRKTFGIGPVVELVPNNALPTTSSGKLRRRWARQAYLSGEFRLDPRQ